jgi:hypothetical protein
MVCSCRQLPINPKSFTSIPNGPVPRTPSAFATARGKLSYATTSTRPELSCSVNQSAQIRADLAKERDFVKLDAAIAQGHENDIWLHFPALELESVELRVYADASFANNTDLSSQLRCTIFMVDKKSKCSPLVQQKSSSCHSFDNGSRVARVVA